MVNLFYDCYNVLSKVYSEKTFIKQALASTVIEPLNKPKTVKICYGVLDKDIELDYYIGCLCVIPKFQRKGIGHQLIEFMKTQYSDWKKIELITPIDKEKNVKFYTEKCGFMIDNEEMDRSVKVYHFSMSR